MTQHRHLYWDSGNKDLRMFSDGGGTSGTTLEVISYFLRKRYAYLLDTGGLDIPGTLGTTGQHQPDAQWVFIGGAYNTHRQMGQHTEADDNLPPGYPGAGAEPDTNFTSDQTSTASELMLYYQNQTHSPVITVPTEATINNTGLLYWSSPDLKIGPISEGDLQDTLADHCLTQMISGDEVGTYRVAKSDPGGGTWSDKGQFMEDTTYFSTGGTYDTSGTHGYGIDNYQQTVVGDYRLYLKTANTTEPSTPDNYIRWDDTNNEIQLESSTDYSATAKLINDVYLNIIKRRHPLYTVHTTQTGTLRGTIEDKIIGPHGYYSVVLGVGGGAPAPPPPVADPIAGLYTRTYEPTGTLQNNTATRYFNLTGNRVPA